MEAKGDRDRDEAGNAKGSKLPYTRNRPTGGDSVRVVSHFFCSCAESEGPGGRMRLPKRERLRPPWIGAEVTTPTHHQYVLRHWWRSGGVAPWREDEAWGSHDGTERGLSKGGLGVVL